VAQRADYVIVNDGKTDRNKQVDEILKIIKIED
jgi:hypothetical protein